MLEALMGIIHCWVITGLCLFRHWVKLRRQRMGTKAHFHQRFCLGQAGGLESVLALVDPHGVAGLSVPPTGRLFVKVSRLNEGFLDLLSSRWGNFRARCMPTANHAAPDNRMTVIFTAGHKAPLNNPAFGSAAERHSPYRATKPRDIFLVVSPFHHSRSLCRCRRRNGKRNEEENQ